VSGSNNEWGALAEHDEGIAALYDGYQRLPEPGENDALDAFVARKNLTIPALVRLGARLAGTLTLAIPFPGGLKYRSIEGAQKWNAPGSEFEQLKVMRAGGTTSDTVLIAEGETDGARLTLLYPAADVAVLPLGAKTWKPGYTEQLAGYSRVVACLDADEAGEEGYAKIKDALPQAVRLTPPANPDNDWCGLPPDAEPPALPEPDTSAEVVGGIVFTELDFDAEIPEPEVLVDDLLYTEGVHLISGHPGCGKTTLAAHLAIDVILDKGRQVVWLDYESGKPQTLRRFKAMNTPPSVTESLHYALWPVDAEKHLGAVAQRWPGALVVLDSMSKALAQAGIDENANSEVVTWTTQIVKACKDFGLPIVIIDHIAKSGGSSEYSRGAGTKLADVDVHWRVLKTSEFNRTTVGSIEVKQMKDREGYFPFATWWEVGDGNGALTLQPMDGPPADQPEDSNAPAI
jgi:energy-coupling factor transporter ATP-binding protein EcfA2